MSLEQEQLKYLLDLQLRWIERSETKVNFFVPMSVAMSAVLVALLAERDVTSIAYSVSISVYFVLTALCLFSALNSVVPRLNGPPQSLVFFGGICRYNAHDYREKIKSLELGSFREDLIDQIYINAQVANIKHRAVKFSLFVFAWSIPLWLFSVYGVS